MPATYLTDEQITETMIAKSGECMQRAAYVENVMDSIDIGRIAHAIMLDVSGEGYSNSLACQLTLKRIVRGLNSLGEPELAYVVWTMALMTPAEAAATYGEYAEYARI